MRLGPVRRRAVAYSKIVVLAFAIIASAWVCAGDVLNDLRAKPFGSDFVTFWAASSLAFSGTPAAAYDPEQHRAAEQRAVGRSDIPYFAWFYPPIFLLTAMPLALVPCGWSLAIRLALTGAAYVAVLRRLLAEREALCSIVVCSSVAPGEADLCGASTSGRTNSSALCGWSSAFPRTVHCGHPRACRHSAGASVARFQEALCARRPSLDPAEAAAAGTAAASLLHGERQLMEQIESDLLFPWCRWTMRCGMRRCSDLPRRDHQPAADNSGMRADGDHDHLRRFRRLVGSCRAADRQPVE